MGGAFVDPACIGQTETSCFPLRVWSACPFSRPTYKYETYYQESQAHGLKVWHQPRRLKKERQVLTGYQSETQFAPLIQVTLTRGKERLQLPETLVYWHHLRFDPQRKVFLDVNNEGVYGRMWPFGVRQTLYQMSLLRK